MTLNNNEVVLIHPPHSLSAEEDICESSNPFDIISNASIKTNEGSSRHLHLLARPQRTFDYYTTRDEEGIS